MESVLRALLEVPFWCSFRDPTGVNVHITFRLPPITTIYGLVANSMGLSQDDYSLRPRLRFAIGIERAGKLVESYSKIMKASRSEDADDTALTGNTYGSTLVVKQKLISPAFWIYILASPTEFEMMRAALHNPSRPLYLGESDDMVDVVDPQIVTSSTLETNHLDCAIPGIYAPQDNSQTAAVINLPYHFVRRGRNDWGLLRRLYTYSLNSAPLAVEQPQMAFEVQGKHIIFEPPIEEISS